MMKAQMERSLRCDNGHAASSSCNNKIQDMDKGRFMEYESEKPQKRMIDCSAEDHGQDFTYLSFDNYNNDNPLIENFDHDDLWEEKDSAHYFSLQELNAQTLPVDYFYNRSQTQKITDDELLTWMCSILKHAPNARPMLKEASEKDWFIALDDLEGSDYRMNVEERTLILDNSGLSADALARSDYFLNRLLVIMTKTLRDVWQEKRFGGFDEDYTPKNVILMERVRAADLDILSILVAWELQAEGYEECWYHLTGSQSADMAMVFSSYLERKPAQSLDMRQALLAAFKQWFNEPSRIDSCDHDTLEYLDEVLENSEFVNPFGYKQPGKMNIEMLSCLPGKSAYLQGLGGEIIRNSHFTAITNDINKAHLNHITHDIESVTIEHVSFRDSVLAQKIFPENFAEQ